MKTLFILIVAILGAPAYSASLSQQDQDKIMSKIKTVKDAFYANNFTVSINMMPEQFFKHSKVSKSSMLAIANKTMEKLKKAGKDKPPYKIISLEYSNPSESYQCKQSTIVFIPGKMMMEVKNQKISSNGFMIASRAKPESEWRLLDGAHPLARQTSFYDKMYGCQGVKLSIPRYSVKTL